MNSRCKDPKAPRDGAQQPMGVAERVDGGDLSDMAMEIDSLMAVVESAVDQAVYPGGEQAHRQGLSQILGAAREKLKYLWAALDSIETYGATRAVPEQEDGSQGGNVCSCPAAPGDSPELECVLHGDEPLPPHEVAAARWMARRLQDIRENAMGYSLAELVDQLTRRDFRVYNEENPDDGETFLVVKAWSRKGLAEAVAVEQLIDCLAAEGGLTENDGGVQ